MFNLTSTVLSDTAGNAIKTDVLLPPFLPDSNTLNNVPDAFKNVFSEFSGAIYKYFEIFSASMRNHFNSLNGQLADLRKENSLLRTEIQKLTDKLSQKELLQNKSQNLPLSNVLSYADTIKRCASVVVMPKELFDWIRQLLYSVETTYGINSVISKLMTIVEITETGQFLFLIMLILSYFTCS
jgi:regulator of replication initiation timing